LDLREKQEQYEQDHDAAAAARKLQELLTASREGDVELPRASRLIARIHGDVFQSIETAKNVMTRGTGGKFKNWLRKIPSDVAALIAIRECIRMCSADQSRVHCVTIQHLGLSIGRLYETEIRIHEAEAVNPVYMQKVHDQVRDHCTRSQSHLRKLYNKAYDNIMKGALDSELIRSEQIQLGKFGVQACLDAGLIEQVRGTGSMGTLVQFVLAEEVRDFLTGYSHRDVSGVIDKATGAMLCQPDEWTSLTDGGYLTQRRKVASPLLPLVSIRKGERARVAAAFTAENMPLVFAAGNYLQSIPYAVHAPTFAAIRRLWEAGGGVLGVPDRKGPQRPDFPFDEEWDRHDPEVPEDELKHFSDWKSSVRRYYDDRIVWHGKVREIGGFIRVTNLCPDRFWFPVYTDKRGRWYYRGSPNPQGSDLAKAVLHFADKKPLGKEGLYWLKVHIANSFGFDKERFDERARWTDQHWTSIERALDAPEDHTDVWGTDAPWCMFSAAWELREAYRSGDPTSYVSGIPGHQDATCSGLQHFSAMLRDPNGGRYVNLLDELQCGPKQDIYGRVANVALQAIQRDLEASDEDTREMAAWWVETGISRTLAKKPVMTYVYGATLSGTTSFIQDHIVHDLKKPWPRPSASYKYSQYAAKKLFQGIAATVPAAAEAMRWLREIAQQQPNGQRMEWKTPTGFLVQHDYVGYDEVRVKIRSCGLVDTIIRNDNDDTNGLRMQNAIAPNFVHAMDASHLTLVANRMMEENLSLVGIHDSFGTHMCDVSRMHRIIREEFVKLYSPNILGTFLWDVKAVGETPARGNLDLTQVLDSEFFFC